ncbi:MAG TPA: PilZ domain-containing protein [Blastocatellia bacterium]|nr:PilZ domain-containing protein [Blastocatellia bacterium]
MPERRLARRFRVGWTVTVRGIDSAGAAYDEPSHLENLSSTGAFVYLTKPVGVGAELEVRIKVPFKKENWMRYPAEVVRVENAPSKVGVAVRFGASRPVFVAH